jgi:hypothetical protein
MLKDIPGPGGCGDGAKQKHSGLVDGALHRHGLPERGALAAENLIV